ncbi:hypothetical protein [Halomonas sp. BN3-1]|uniref:hypothetical protein n=1 Tax=Halomonas sp. BN3-1 TaxID=2082393 RepID=UPI0013B3804A|nr:hypothetical protein [Halomonas sp. BN3-1]
MKLIKQTTILCIVFFSIVGIKFDSGFDTVYFLSLFFSFYLIARGGQHGVLLILFTAIFLLFLSLINYVVYGYVGSIEFSLRYLLLVMLGGGLCSFLIQHRIKLEDFRKIFVVCVFINSIFVILQKMVPGFADFIYGFSSVSSQTTGYFYGVRFPGLLYAGNAVNGTLHGIGLVWASYYYFNNYKLNLMWLVVSLVIFVSLFLMARTGVFIFLICLMLSFVFYSRKRRIVFLLPFFVISIIVLSPYIKESLIWFLSDFSSGDSETFSRLSKMVVVSQAEDTFASYLFGSGSSGRDSFYLESDIGYTRYSLMFGFVGTCVLLFPYFVFLITLLKAFLRSCDPAFLVVLCLTFFVVFVGAGKEIFIGLKGITIYFTIEYGYHFCSRNKNWLLINQREVSLSRFRK